MNRRFTVTDRHLRQGLRNSPERNPLAQALRETGLIQNPWVLPVRTLETDGTGRKTRSYRHSPPLTRWLNQWEKRQNPGPILLEIDHLRRRISTRRAGADWVPGIARP